MESRFTTPEARTQSWSDYQEVQENTRLHRDILHEEEDRPNVRHSAMKLSIFIIYISLTDTNFFMLNFSLNLNECVRTIVSFKFLIIEPKDLLGLT